MIQSVTTAVPAPPHFPLLASDREQPPPAGDGSALLSKRSGSLSLSVASAVRTAKADNELASSVDAAAVAVVVDAYSSSFASEKSLELSAAEAASTAMETIAIDADSNNDGRSVTLRRNVSNSGWGGGQGRRL